MAVVTRSQNARNSRVDSSTPDGAVTPVDRRSSSSIVQHIVHVSRSSSNLRLANSQANSAQQSPMSKRKIRQARALHCVQAVDRYMDQSRLFFVPPGADADTDTNTNAHTYATVAAASAASAAAAAAAYTTPAASLPLLFLVMPMAQSLVLLRRVI
ncbi:hypothetical protein GGI07_005469 [Coemansia sp. Benny D115]|nr:hypothetical protein GGI07_005469 [Coemansia sp. Benny D115]